MKLPRYAAFTLTLDTERFKQRPTFQLHGSEYLLSRLLSGDDVATRAIEDMGIRVSVRPASSGEIVK